MSRYLKKLLSSVVAFILVSISLIPLSVSAENFEKSEGAYEIKYNESDRVIVSLGDSFSSGEGIDNFYDYNLPIVDKVKSQDWLSHRSQNSWSGKLTLKDSNGNPITMKDHRNDNWYFVAMSGAITSNILDTNPIPEYSYRFKKYCKIINTFDNETKIKGFQEIEPQLNVYNQLGDKKVDYVTMTMGGNDVDFVPVVINAACQFNFIEFDASVDMTVGNVSVIHKEIEYHKPIIDTLNKIIEEKLPPTLSRLEECYKTIDSKSNKHATILIAGYPRLFGEKHKGVIFDTIEIEKINEAVDIFNRSLEEKITELRTKQGMNIYFVPVADAFGKHGAYSGTGIFSDKGAYINSIYLPKEQDIDDSSFVSAYSIHPNEDGAKVYAECVQNKIDDLENNYTKIWGQVTDEDGNAFNNVKVTLMDNKNNSYISKNTENGYYAFEIPNDVASRYNIITYDAQTPGYRKLIVNELKNEKRITVNAKLKKVSGQQTQITVSGTVVDNNNQPIKDATVILSGGENKAVLTTDGNGKYSCEIIDTSNVEYTLEIAKLGYTIHKETFTITSNVIRNVTLEKPKAFSGEIKFEVPENLAIANRVFYAHIWNWNGLPGGAGLYTWQTKEEKMTWNKGDSIATYNVPKGDWNLIIISGNSGIFQTYDCVFNSSCIGDTCYVMDESFKNPVDSKKSAKGLGWRNNPDCGPHKVVSSIGNVIGTSFLPGENNQVLYDDFIKKYDTNNIADPLNNIYNWNDDGAIETGKDWKTIKKEVAEKLGVECR